MPSLTDLAIPAPEPFDRLLSLEGRVAIVTGGSRGIGEAIVVRLVEAGAKVIVTGRTAASLDELEAKIGAVGGIAIGVRADAASLSDSQRVIDTAIDRFGRLDILVNNAAVFPGAVTTELNEAIWDLTLDADLKGAFFLSKMAALKMIEGGRGGSIVNILSTEMVRPTGILAAYGAAKAGLLAISQSMAKELGRHSIRVNCVVPGSTFTEEKVDALKAGHLDGPFVQIGNDVPETAKVVEAMFDAFGSAIDHMPMRRPGWPDEIAKAVLFMASDMASYVNGTSLMVEGGQIIA